MSIIRKRAIVPPTLEESMGEIVKEVKQYAPPQHADRVSATSKIMCDAIEKVFSDTAAGIDARVSELKTMVSEIDDGVNQFKDAMRNAASSLKERVQEVMSHYEDITAKLQESPFNGHLPTFLEKDDVRASE